MNPQPLLALLTARRRRKRLEATMRPDPEFRKKRLAQFSPERLARIDDNLAKAYHPE